MRCLDLGCGSRKTPSSIGVDITRGSAADIIANLNRPFYPFQDNVFDYIVFNQVIEHLADIPIIMEEIWRIGKSGAVLEGITPHFSSAASYSDPTHRHHLSIRTFEFLARPAAKQPGKIRRVLNLFYRSPQLEHRPLVGQKFEILETRITLNPLFRKLGLEWVINLYPELYEAFFPYLLPARDIAFKLRILKD